jgi:hypothetical protein
MSLVVLPDTPFCFNIVRTVEKTKLLPLFYGDIGHMLYRRLRISGYSFFWWYMTETVILTVL